MYLYDRCPHRATYSVRVPVSSTKQKLGLNVLSILRDDSCALTLLDGYGYLKV